MLLIISRSGLIFKCLEMKGDKKLKQSYDVLNGSQQNLQENSNEINNNKGSKTHQFHIILKTSTNYIFPQLIKTI